MRLASMPCSSISSRVIACTSLPVFRVAKLVFLIESCVAFRPDDGETEIPKGFKFHAEGMLDNNGLEIDSLLLQRQHGEHEDRSLRQSQLAANFTQQLAGTATHLHIHGPSALQQIHLTMTGPENPQKDTLFCDASQAGWGCMEGNEKAPRIPVGGTCHIACTDTYNFKPEKADVKCIDRNGVGEFDTMPECQEVEHCENPGDSWRCTDAYLTGDAKRPIVGKPCTPKCGDDNQRASVPTAMCQAGKSYDKEIKCINKNVCKSDGDQWECEEMEGKPVHHGEQCKVKCKKEKMVPVHPMVTCNGEEGAEGADGLYQPDFPRCLSENEAKEARAQAAQEAEKKKTGEAEGSEEEGKNGAITTALPRFVAVIGLLSSMLMYDFHC